MVSPIIKAILKDGKVTDRELVIALAALGVAAYVKSSK